jgi:hypothetical protein
MNGTSDQDVVLHARGQRMTRSVARHAFESFSLPQDIFRSEIIFPVNPFRFEAALLSGFDIVFVAEVFLRHCQNVTKIGRSKRLSVAISDCQKPERFRKWQVKLPLPLLRVVVFDA